jgi:hypothetical protein
MITSSRRAVLATAGAALLCSHALSAQEAGRSYRIGILAGVPRQTPHWVAFFDELEKTVLCRRQKPDRGLALC